MVDEPPLWKGGAWSLSLTCVMCHHNTTSNFVGVLDLSGNGFLTGAIPSQIGLMTDLVTLNLNLNSMGFFFPPNQNPIRADDPFPTEIGLMTSLRKFDACLVPSLSTLQLFFSRRHWQDYRCCRYCTCCCTH